MGEPARKPGSRAQRGPGRKGFTLLEALVVLVLTAIITAGVALALRTGLDAGARIRERADSHAEARAVLDRLSEDLSQAYLSGVNTSTTQFVGRPASNAAGEEPFLSLTTLSYRRRAAPGQTVVPPRADAVRVDYVLRPSAPGRQVLVRRERWLTETGPGESAVLSERVADLRLGYMGHGDFEDTWDATPEKDAPLSVSEEEDSGYRPPRRTLPRAVELTLVMAPGEEDPEGRLPRMYRTVIRPGADGVAPFEVEVEPAQRQAPQAPRGEREERP